MKKLIFTIGIGVILTGCSLFGNKIADESLQHLEDKFYNSMVESFEKGEIGNSYQQDMNLTLNVNKNPMLGVLGNVNANLQVLAKVDDEDHTNTKAEQSFSLSASMEDEALPPFNGELNFEMKTFDKEMFFKLVKMKVNSPMLALDLQDEPVGKWYKTTSETLNEFYEKTGMSNVQLNESTVTQRDINNFIKDVKTVLDETQFFNITSKVKTENDRYVFDVEVPEENATPIILGLFDAFYKNLNSGQISADDIEKIKKEITDKLDGTGKVVGKFSFDKNNLDYFEFSGDLFADVFKLKVAKNYLEISVTEDESTFVFVMDNENMSAKFDEEEVMKGIYNEETFEGKIMTAGTPILDFNFDIANKESMSGKITFIPRSIVLDIFKLNASADGKKFDMGLKVTQAETELGNLYLSTTMTSGKVEIEKPTDAEEITDMEEFTNKIQSQIPVPTMEGLQPSVITVSDPFTHCRELPPEEQEVCMKEVMPARTNIDEEALQKCMKMPEDEAVGCMEKVLGVEMPKMEVLPEITDPEVLEEDPSE